MRKQLATLARTGAHFIFLKFTNRIYSQTWNGIPFIKKVKIITKKEGEGFFIARYSVPTSDCFYYSILVFRNC
ncbi:hypothetical protein RIR_jg32138.t1 [Rhizophagus irregularis DAOM 181602=DAOM 197198]|nr:hypothetical protein RIR_jg32138.t1 [Rhizophagus irregularis DAOM 181602=DAOM 197198]